MYPSALPLIALAFASGQRDGPPVSSRVCYDGRCIVESFPRTPYIVFFHEDGDDRMIDGGSEVVKTFAQQHQWWPHLTPSICVATGDHRGRQRVARLRALIRAEGYRRIRVRREGKDCEIVAGSRRASGFIAYQLDL